jgi:hypothetical protein
VPTRAPRPYQGHGDADPKGIAAGRAGLEPASYRRSRRRRPCRQSNRPEPFPSADLGGLPVQGAGGRRSKGHRCARPDLNRDRLAALAPRASVSARFHHEREPPPGVEPGRPPYEGGAASRARRHELPLMDSNHDQRIQSAPSCLLNERASSTRGGTRTRRRQLLRQSALPVSVTRAYAAGESNPALRIKSPQHHHNACSAESRTGELNPDEQVGSLSS